MYWTLVSDEDEYKEASPEERDNYWLIPLGDMVLRLPIPFEVGLLFKTIPETVLDVTYGDRTSRQAFETVKRGVTSTLEFDPVFDTAFPHCWRRLLIKQFHRKTRGPGLDDGKLPEEQATDYTSELGRFIGDAGCLADEDDHIMKLHGHDRACFD